MASSALGFLEGIIQQVLEQAAGYGIGGATSTAIQPLAQAIANEIWTQFPDMPLSPADAANARQQGLYDQGKQYSESLLSGVNNDRAEIMFHLVGLPPGPQELGAMLLRGIIDDAAYAKGIAQGHTKTEYTDQLKQLLQVVLPPDAVAQMVVQNIVTDADGKKLAAMMGVDAATFENMVHVRGRPISPQEATALYLRGEFTEAQFAQAIAESDIKTKYTPELLALTKQILTAAEAAQMRVQNILTEDEAVKIAEQNGYDKATFDAMWEVRGRPISPTEAIELANRGELTKAVFDQVIAESDIKTKYTDQLWALRVKYPSVTELRRLIERATISDADAEKALKAAGYDDSFIKGFIAEAHDASTSVDKQLTKTEILNLYEGQAVDQSTAAAMLGDLGYDQQNTEYLLTMSDFRRVAQAQNSAISRVHSRFVSHRIGVDDVTNTLDALGVPSAQRQQLLGLWEEEKAANVSVLTPTQIADAAQKGFIQVNEAVAKLEVHGYTERDALIMLAIHKVNVQIPAWDGKAIL